MLPPPLTVGQHATEVTLVSLLTGWMKKTLERKSATLAFKRLTGSHTFDVLAGDLGNQGGENHN